MELIYEGLEYFDNLVDDFFIRGYNGLVNGYLEYKFDLENLGEI